MNLFQVIICKYFKSSSLLKKLKGNKNLVNAHPDKGNGVVIMNRKQYDKVIYDILEDNSEFKKLKKDPTLIKEGQLKQFVRTSKKTKVSFMK